MQETRPLEMSEEQAKELGRLRREFFDAEAEGADLLEAHMDQRLGELNREHQETLVRRKPVGRNDPCPCGSGRKFKRCCARVSITGLSRR